MINLKNEILKRANVFAPYESEDKLKKDINGYLKYIGVSDVPDIDSEEWNKIVDFLEIKIGSNTLYSPSINNLTSEDIYKDIMKYANNGELLVIGKEIKTNKPIFDLLQYQELSKYFNLEESENNWDYLMQLLYEVDLILMEKFVIEDYPDKYKLLDEPVTYSEYSENSENDKIVEEIFDVDEVAEKLFNMGYNECNYVLSSDFESCFDFEDWDDEVAQLSNQLSEKYNLEILHDDLIETSDFDRGEYIIVSSYWEDYTADWDDFDYEEYYGSDGNY